MSPSPRTPRDPRNHLLWPVLSGARLRGRTDRPALLGGGRVIRFDELDHITARGAEELDGRFPPDTRVLIAAYDQLLFAILFLSALRSRVLPLLVDPLVPATLADLAARWEVCGALGERKLLERTSLPLVDEADAWRWNAGPRREAELRAVRGNEPAFITFTSGTTGVPRAVAHAHRGPAAAHAAFASGVVGLREGDRTISTAGLPFVYALGNALLFPLLTGATAILPQDLLLPTVLGEMGRNRATVLVSGPWSLEAMVRLADRARWSGSLRELRLVLSAGEPLPASLFRRWRNAFGQEVLDNLGCTEMFNSFISSRPGEASPGILGHAVPGFEMRVAGVRPRPHLRGALAVRGESRAVGMSPGDGSARIDPPASDWCETGDEVAVDASGRIVYLGRLDDRFKVRGQLVCPTEIEQCALELDAVSECLVEPEDGPDHLTRIRIRVVPVDGRAERGLASRVAAHLRTRLGPYLRSASVDLVESLPRSERGKRKRAHSANA